MIPSDGAKGTEASSTSTDPQPPLDTVSTTSSTFGTASGQDDTGHEWSDTGTSDSSPDGTSSVSGTPGSSGGSTGGPSDDSGSTGAVDPCAYSIFDDFEDRVVDEDWHQNTPPGTEVFEKDGQLQLSLPPLPESHLIVSRQLDQAMVGGYVRAHLTGIDDASGLASSGIFLSIGVCDLQIYAHGGMLRVHRWSDIEGNEQLYSEPLDPDFPQWLQLRQDDGGAVFFELSVDEVQWTVLFSDAFPECGDAFAPPKIGVFAGGDSLWSVVRRFESISVCAPSPEFS